MTNAPFVNSVVITLINASIVVAFVVLLLTILSCHLYRHYKAKKRLLAVKRYRENQARELTREKLLRWQQDMELKRKDASIKRLQALAASHTPSQSAPPITIMMAEKPQEAQPHQHQPVVTSPQRPPPIDYERDKMLEMRQRMMEDRMKLKIQKMKAKHLAKQIDAMSDAGAHRRGRTPEEKGVISELKRELSKTKQLMVELQKRQTEAKEGDKAAEEAKKMDKVMKGLAKTQKDLIMAKHKWKKAEKKFQKPSEKPGESPETTTSTEETTDSESSESSGWLRLKGTGGNVLKLKMVPSDENTSVVDDTTYDTTCDTT